MISADKINEAIEDAGFPRKKREAAAAIITIGLKQFREYEKNWSYYQKTNVNYR